MFKKRIQNIFAGVFVFILSNFLNYKIFSKNHNNISNQNEYSNWLYEKCNEKYCKYLSKLTLYPISTQNNKKSQITPNSLSEIQISNNFFNLKNIYPTNCNQLIFHQLSYHFTNTHKVYNFGLGNRNYYNNQWIIGNNIFYDTLLSRNKQKIMSIGHEFLKNSTHITINTYHNVSEDNFIYIRNKKFLPFAYDIHIKNNLPFFINTYGKINIEYYCNNKHYNRNTYYLQNINPAIKQCRIHNNIYKVTLRISCTPIEIFTFIIDKTIFNSMKNYETKFNILATYKIKIPWIYETTNTINETIHDAKIKNNEYSIYRNNTILFKLKYKNEHSNTIKKITQHDIQCTTSEQQLNTSNNTPSSLELVTFDNLNNNENILPCTPPPTKNEISNNNISLIFEPTHTNLTPNPQIQELQNNKLMMNNDNQQKINHATNINNNSEFLPEQKNNDNYQDLTIFSINNVNNLYQPSLQNTPQQQTSQTEQIQTSNIHVNPNIPPPPSISNFLQETNQSNDVVKINRSDYKTYVDNNNQNLDKLTHDIESINKHKKNKFSSLGSEEHLLRLSHISKKRKKTISTSSNDSNDSESIRLIKIIERQSILTTNNTDSSDENNSMTSNDEFSE